jgi:hypothetical protein
MNSSRQHLATVVLNPATNQTEHAACSMQIAHLFGVLGHHLAHEGDQAVLGVEALQVLVHVATGHAACESSERDDRR